MRGKTSHYPQGAYSLMRETTCKTSMNTEYTYKINGRKSQKALALGWTKKVLLQKKVTFELSPETGQQVEVRRNFVLRR